MPDEYIIRRGDTVTKIAEKLDVTVEQFLEANPDLENPNAIHIGDKLSLPDNAAQGVLEVVYTVQPGDTLSEIARDRGLTANVLMGANPDIIDPSAIKAGQDINIPVAGKTFEAPVSRVDLPVRVSSSIAKGAIESAWDVVEGKTARASFNAAVLDTRPLVVIDPGHNAYNKSETALDPGAVSRRGLTEVHVVDPVAQALGDRLGEQGFRVAFTRNPGEEYRYSAADEPGRLASRAKFAHALEDQLGAPYTLFVSLHANSASPSAEGFEVLVDKDGKGRGGRGTESSACSVKLADSVLGKMDGCMGLKNRGLKTYNASVLNTMECGDPGSGQEPDAAILIELGFLSNAGDEKTLTDMSRNPQEMAGRIAGGIQEYAESRQAPAQTLLASLDMNSPPEV